VIVKIKSKGVENMNKQVTEGSLVGLTLALEQDGQRVTAETEILYGFQSVLPVIDEHLKGKKEGDKFKLCLSPRQMRRWRRQKLAEVDLNRPLKVEVVIKRVEMPNPDELLHRVRQLFAGCSAGG